MDLARRKPRCLEGPACRPKKIQAVKGRSSDRRGEASAQERTSPACDAGDDVAASARRLQPRDRGLLDENRQPTTR
ncbi:unnamed protein product, partial [Urochloa humidicola]